MASPSGLLFLRAAALALLAIGAHGAAAQGLTEFSSLRQSSIGAGNLLPPIGASLHSGLQSPFQDPAGNNLIELAGMFEAIQESLYIVGPGDVFSVGLGNKTSLLVVNPEGKIVIETVGPIVVTDLTLVEARKILVAHAARVFKGDRIFASLAKAKRIQVSIAGAVSNPGIYSLEATSRLTEGLVLAGGFATQANRRVRVASRTGDTSTYDIDRYRRTNDMAQNPYLRAGDQVLALEVDHADETVEIRENEMVATVQLKPGQTVLDLLSGYYLGKKARTWDVIRVHWDGKLKATLTRKDAASYVPRSGDVLELHAYKPLVFVTGAVARPAALDYNVNFNALDYMSMAGIQPFTGNFHRLEVVGADGTSRWVDTSRDRIAPGDHILVTQNLESRTREWIGLLVSVASIAASITLTVVTLENRNN